MFLTLLIILAVTQILDYVTTSKILAKPGGNEQNPIMAKLFDKIGVLPTFLIKGISVIVVGYFLGTHNLDLLLGLDLVYSIIIAWNLRSLV